MGSHGGGVEGEAAEEQGLGELKGSLLQAGKARGEVKKPKCQRRHY
jgi:hypothetical protein